MIADDLTSLILGLASGQILGSCYWLWVNHHRDLIQDRYKFNYVFWSSVLAVGVILYFVYRMVTAVEMVILT